MAFNRALASSISLALCAAGSLLISTAPFAAGRANADTVYQRERAACNSGQSGQDRATCLKEAGAARMEARRGGLDEGQGQLEKNRLLRCDNQPPQDRQDCVRRMNGEGFTSGSVQGGGVLRELVTPVEPAQRN